METLPPARPSQDTPTVPARVKQAPACPACAAADDAAPPATAVQTSPLDLSTMAAPADLEQSRIEDLSIDGICGVY